MDELSAGSLVFLISILTQFVKSHWSISPKYAQLMALGFSFVLLLPFYILTELIGGASLEPLALAWLCFRAFVAMLVGWLASIGAYEVGVKKFAK